MNGIAGGVSVAAASGTPVYQIILRVLDVLWVLALAIAEFFTIRFCRKEAPVLTEEEKKKRRKKAIIKVVVTIVIIIAVAVGVLMYIDSQMIGESVFDYIFH